MELPQRALDDVYLPDGEFRQRVRALRRLTHAHELAIGIINAFDFRTRMLPFWYADKRMAPCSVRLLADVLHDAGFTSLRIVLQQWSPNVLPSRMRLNRRTWRPKSPRRFAAEIKHIHENFGIRAFFGTDDNFFNNRDSVKTLMAELGRTTTGGVPLGKRIKFYTEGTQTDVFKNRDLLPMCRNAGLRGLWFSIEDLIGRLVKKGQSADRTEQLFAFMNKLGIQPHAMMIHMSPFKVALSRVRGGDISTQTARAHSAWNSRNTKGRQPFAFI